MSTEDWSAQFPELVDILRIKLSGKESCREIVDDYEDVLRSILSFISRLLGAMGTGAVLARSVRLAAEEEPLLQLVRVSDGTADFDALRERAAKVDCNPSEVLISLLRLSTTIFKTLTDLSGDAVTKSLLKHLEEKY